ncbi:CitMHS family transporter [Anaeroselena agilis]|uniref:Citrate:proton symporter n=1 Tax=Anaeroselena agilis TaxID=3063788 RepID=A0ABU3P0E1_9FIRM|nr:citrate:proton symporter [Selenomonadales bacterium 4137-cl]
MLSLWGFCIIAALLFLIMTKRASVIVALVAVPAVFGALAGFGPKLGAFAFAGIKSVAPVGVMLTFAILYFGVMNDAGLFDPAIKRIVRYGGGDPVKVAVGTALIAMLAHMDGSGASTFLIAVPALLPIYDKLGMDRKVLACLVALGAGTMNMLPWGGPTLRAATSLHLNMTELFNPVIPAQLAGLATVLAFAYLLGRRERARIGVVKFAEESVSGEEEKVDPLKRPKLVWFNAILTIAAIVALVQGKLIPLPVVFMVALVIALIVNYPDVKMQQERIVAQGKSAVFMIAIIFAAGIFTGILTKSGMIKAMAGTLVAIVPKTLGGHLPVLTAITSMPASLLFDPDSYYFGILPVLSTAAEAMGVAKVEVARAAILGQMTTGFPVSPLTASTFLLVGLAGVDLGDHQKFTIPFAFGVTLVMTIVAVLTGAFVL